VTAATSARALCIVGVDQNRVLKDFVRAHVELLHGPTVTMEHWYPDFTHEGQTIRYFYSNSPGRARAKKLLPQFLYGRLVQRNELSDSTVNDAMTAFLRRKHVDVILAEFGPNGADILPHARNLGLPLIVHFHGHDAHRKAVVDQYAERYKAMFDYAFRIVSVSRTMTEALVALGADRSKIVFNPYGPRDTFFDIQPKYGKTVISLGRFTDIKANYLSLAAFRQVLELHPDAKLVMAGDGELLETCKTLARTWQIEKSVSFPGAVLHADAGAFYASGSVFIQHSVTPSYGDAEGTPVTILEASAAGLPVVATRHAGITQAVVDGTTGSLVDERDVDGMARSISRLLDSVEDQKRMGAVGRAHIRRNYSLSQHIGVLQELIDSARERREPSKNILRREGEA
jgi:colanic acid/amylovoran biosynthesis glycosyltransferase